MRYTLFSAFAAAILILDGIACWMMREPPQTIADIAVFVVANVALFAVAWEIACRLAELIERDA